MKPIEILSEYQMNTVSVPDGCDFKEVPEPTKENMQKLVDKIEELTDAVNLLLERQGLLDQEVDL